VRRLRALILFTLGYSLMALLSPAVATLPALVIFALASFVLLQRDDEDEPVRERAHAGPPRR
jgi:hypothetical protein